MNFFGDTAQIHTIGCDETNFGTSFLNEKNSSKSFKSKYRFLQIILHYLFSRFENNLKRILFISNLLNCPVTILNEFIRIVLICFKKYENSQC